MASPLIHTPSSPRRARARFEDRTVHVWSARLDLPRERVQQLERSLTPLERERSPHRRLSRALLREVLAGYAGASPADLRLEGDADQKPRLAESPHGRELHFNLSHSGDMLLIAIARTAQLGVDLERLRPVRRAETIAKRAFTAGEREAIASLPVAQRDAAFFNCWTRKEACVKAVGLGVWAAFGQWEVTVAPEEPARVLRADGGTEAAEAWSLFHLEPSRGYVGALAIHGSDWQIEAWALGPRETIE